MRRHVSDPVTGKVPGAVSTPAIDVGGVAGLAVVGVLVVGALVVGVLVVVGAVVVEVVVEEVAVVVVVLVGAGTCASTSLLRGL